MTPSLMPELEQQIGQLKREIEELRQRVEAPPRHLKDVPIERLRRTEEAQLGLPVWTLVPTHTGFEGEMVLYSDTANADYRFYTYLNGGWRKLADIDFLTSGITFADTEVYNANASTSWADLDLSGTVGNNTALVHLRVENLSANASQDFKFRPNGDTRTPEDGTVATRGVLDANEVTFILVKTDSSGVIEWVAGSAWSTQIKVLAYLT